MAWYEKQKNLHVVFLFQKYGKYGRTSLGHFIKHKPLISEEYTFIYMICMSKNCTDFILNFAWCTSTLVNIMTDFLLGFPLLANNSMPYILYIGFFTWKSWNLQSFFMGEKIRNSSFQCLKKHILVEYRFTADANYF